MYIYVYAFHSSIIPQASSGQKRFIVAGRLAKEKKRKKNPPLLVEFAVVDIIQLLQEEGTPGQPAYAYIHPFIKSKCEKKKKEKKKKKPSSQLGQPHARVYWLYMSAYTAP